MKLRTAGWMVGALALASGGLLQAGCGDRGSGEATTAQPAGGTTEADTAVSPSTEPAASAPGTAATNTTPPRAGSAAGDAAPTRAPVPPPAPSPPPPPRTFTIRSDTPLEVQTTGSLSTETNKVGEAFTAILANAIADGDWVIAKQGARVEGVIVDSDPGGRVKGVASMAIALRKLTLADGRTVELQTNSVSLDAKTSKGKDAKKIGIGAGVGAAIGAIAGGGKGAAIGAAVGGGAGTASALATHGEAATLPSESRLAFTLTAPVKITKQ